ncbi:MAG TPA: MFS transporter [Pseudonocardia sp.]|jgi:dTMP kinase|uniref:bifunctional MFS transporter/dTMP kinase n=1 Tax=Pseudonocardia sp. TaxID=60912 RepID=UPI002F42CB87
MTADSQFAMPSGISSSAAHRVRGVLAIPSFRRLWLVTAISSTGDWLSLLALSALATQLTHGTQAQSFALGGVVATRLLPPLLFGPLAGVLADRFDRRVLMVICDLSRFALFISIPLVGSLSWLFGAIFLIEICSMFWIPAKDASIPNLLKRPDQVETANQLSLAMTYGVSVITASGLFVAVSAIGKFIGSAPSPTTTVYIALVINGFGYLLTSLTVWLRIPEISGRSPGRSHQGEGLLALLRDGAQFVSSTRLVRGLVIGILGAFVAGGAVIALAKLYATNLGGGDAAYGMLFVSVFIGMAIGMSAMPGLARKVPHNRLFGAAIVAAGLSLVLVALAPHLFVALATVAMVGCCAGVAFLTGLTIIGAQVANEVRGRVVAFVQSIVRLDLLASMSVAPIAVGLVQTRVIDIAGRSFHVDGSRTVLGVAGLVASAVGVLAYRQMDDRRSEPLLPDLLGALRRAPRRPVGGVLIAVDGGTPAESAALARRLVAWLESQGYPAIQPQESTDTLVSDGLTGVRARALVAAAARADVVEREVRPALRAGEIVVVDRFLATPLGHPGLRADELESLAGWATDGLRPDVTVLLDRAPTEPTPPGEPMAIGEDHLRVNRLLTRRAAAEPDRYVVVDADGDPEVVAQQVREGVAPLLRRLRRGNPLARP